MVDYRRNSSEIGNSHCNSFVLELQRLRMKEKIAKDLLKIDESLIDKITGLIDEKEQEINSKQLQKKDQEVELLELDIERVKFILKDYLRIRIKKVIKL